MTRKQQLLSELDRILKLLSEDATVKRVILFGSSVDLANVADWSDIDICIIQDTQLRFLDRVANWMDIIEPRVGVDLVIYTPSEFEHLSKSNVFVSKEILERGKDLYAA